MDIMDMDMATSITVTADPTVDTVATRLASREVTTLPPTEHTWASIWDPMATASPMFTLGSRDQPLTSESTDPASRLTPTPVPSTPLAPLLATSSLLLTSPSTDQTLPGRDLLSTSRAERVPPTLLRTTTTDLTSNRHGRLLTLTCTVLTPTASLTPPRPPSTQATDTCTLPLSRPHRSASTEATPMVTVTDTAMVPTTTSGEQHLRYVPIHFHFICA